MNIKSLLIGCALLSVVQAQASSRSKDKIGISYGIASDPGPSLTSWQLKYNINEMFQVGISYGSILALVTTYGANAKFFVLPSWNFSPYVGAGYSMASFTGSFDFGGSTITVSGDNLQSMNLSAGIDHQTNFGLNYGLGIIYFLSPSELSSVVAMLPQFYFGWVF